MAKKMKSYHFDVGNSSIGSIGMCLRVRATTKNKAIAKANEFLVKHYDGVSVTEGEGDIEYCEVYLNGNLTVKDIDEFEPIPDNG